MNKFEELLSSISLPEKKLFRNQLQLLPKEKQILLNCFDNAVEQTDDKIPFDKKSVYIQSTGKKKYNDKEWRYLQSELTELLENFYLNRYLNNQPQLQLLLSYKALTQRKCNKSAQYIYDYLSKDNSILNASYYYNQLEAKETEINYNATLEVRTKDPDFSKLHHNLECYYLAKKLQLLCEQVNYSNMMNVKLVADEETISKASAKPYSEIPVIIIYRSIYSTLVEPENQSHFLQLESIVNKEESILPVSELNNVYTYLKNYCIKQINTGNNEYVLRLFNIYKDYIGNTRLMKSEYLSEFEFKNMVSVSLRLKEISWCKDFIKRYINYLPPGERNNSSNYNQAYFYFQTGDFKGAIRKLRDVAFTDIVYQLDARVILLKSYFELDEDEQFFYHASAFRLYILRNRHLSEYQKKINRNLIRFLTALRRNAGKKKQVELIRKEIIKEKNVADLNWLLLKTEELL